MRAKPLIAVTDVPASSRWYQRLLGCRSGHGGSEYERLLADGQLVLQLHSFDVEHDHGPIGNRDDRPYGNGVLLWFEVDDFDAVVQRANEGPAAVNRAVIMRDPDGYIVVVASPDWSAGPPL